MSNLASLLSSIQTTSSSAAELAAAHSNNLTKPVGSLGKLEDLGIRLAGITGWPLKPLVKKAVVVMAGDHGVARKGVSAYPPEVTPQMVANFLAGGAAINVLSRRAGADVVIVDMGVASDIAGEGFLNRKVAYGTADMTEGPAMTREQAEQAVCAGIEIVRDLHSKGLDIVATGDMGIGNTTPSAAIVSTITGCWPEEVTGRGTGIDNEAFAHKVSMVRKALEVNRPNPQDGLDLLAKVGGFEIAGLCGVVLGAAIEGIPVVVDGFISTAAALVASVIAPEAKNYMVASHQSVEIGQTAALDRLELIPLLDLGFRLGEGTGSAVAFHLIDDAVAIFNEMATFEQAAVSGKC